MLYDIFWNDNPSPLKINAIGWSDSLEVVGFESGYSNYYKIYYVSKGNGYYNGNLVTAGQGFLVYPGQFVEFSAVKDNPWDLLWIISLDDNMEDVFKRYMINPNTLIFNHSANQTIKSVSEELISKRGSFFDSLKLLEIFLHILNSHIEPTLPQGHFSTSDIYINFCMNYIDININRKISTKELLKLLGVSQPYLYRIFMNKFNISPKQYILLCKMNHAKKLLKETDMSIKQIAASVGYDDALAFTRVFSARESMSPKQYRQKEVKNC